MQRMFQATVILFVTFAGYVICYAIFGEPIYQITSIFKTVDPTVTAQIGSTLDFINWTLGATVIFGALSVCIIYFVYAHKKEYEQEE